MNPLIKEFIIFFAFWPFVIGLGVYAAMKLGKGVARLAGGQTMGSALKKNVQRASS